MKEKSKLLFFLTLILSITILVLGAWWMYVIYNYESFLKYREPHKIYQMLFWEGGTFIVLLLLITFSFIYLYFKDQKKAKSLNDFFASITHELKTPLASIKLQGEVIQEYLDPNANDSLKRLLKRLINDTRKLESQLDQLLQLARIERGGELNLELIPLQSFLNKLITDYPELHFQTTNNQPNNQIIADSFALEIIFRNLIENTIRHNQSKNIAIEIKSDNLNQKLELTYFDHGEFKGDLKKLGELFYKHNSHKGSGVGIYLSKKLMKKMHGEYQINQHENGLKFYLKFNTSEVLNA